MTSIRVVKIPPPQSPNTLTLKKLDASSQAGRVVLPGQTRGPKADRLKLVAKINPIAESDAALHNWSATGIAIAEDGNAYISWHSNHQAQTPADRWGGALDVINIGALENLSGATNPENVITYTLTSSNAKFNNVVVNGDNLYLPMTCYNNGAVVGRVNKNSLNNDVAIDTIAIPGSSANAVAVDGSTLYAVSGYAGGVYSMPANFVMRETDFTTVIDYADDFGGKYIAGNYVLRTNDQKSEIVNLNGTVRNEGAPLISEDKYAEAYDPANDSWYPLTGDKAKYYGKHTMAVDGSYIYVGGGQGTEGLNGLRVYAATGPVWQNGTNTTAVCVDEKYVYAATGAGLRVYEKYNSTDRDLKLFAYEVKEYDENGNAIGHQADTDAHSSNFVAVGGGYIFVACGQSGVYVFKLDETIEPEKMITGFVTPNGGGTQEVEEGSDPVTLTVPEGPSVDNKTFKHWVDGDGNPYNAGDTKDFNPGETIELEPVYGATVTFKDIKEVEVLCGEKVPATAFPADPEAPEGKDFDKWVIEGTSDPFTSTTVVNENITVVPTWKDHVYPYVLNFVGWTEDKASEITGVPTEMKQDENSFEIPTTKPVWGDAIFYGWSTEQKNYDFEDPNLIKPGETFVIPEGQTECTLYGVWASEMEGGDKPAVDPEGPSLGGENSQDVGE